MQKVWRYVKSPYLYISKQNKNTHTMSHTSRGFTKYNKNQKQDNNALIHHLARLHMMMQEEKGVFISYEQALKETKK